MAQLYRKNDFITHTVYIRFKGRLIFSKKNLHIISRHTHIVCDINFIDCVG